MQSTIHPPSEKAPSAAWALPAVFAALLVAFPKHALSGGLNAFLLWGRAVVPALFPFFVASTLLNASSLPQLTGRLFAPLLRPLFRLPGSCGLIVFLSWISGSPTGARLTGEMARRGELSPAESLRLAALTTCCGPAFVLSAVGAGMMANPAAGWKLLLAHLLGNILVTLLFRGRGALPAPAEKKQDFPEASFSQAIGEGVQIMLRIGGYIGLFGAIGGVINGVLETAGFTYPFLRTLISAVLEVSAGSAHLAALPLPPHLVLALVGAGLSFGGICVLMQCLDMLKGTGISLVKLIAVKCLHAAITFLLLFLPAL